MLGRGEEQQKSVHCIQWPILLVHFSIIQPHMSSSDTQWSSMNQALYWALDRRWNKLGSFAWRSLDQMIGIYIKPGKFYYGMALQSVLGGFRHSFPGRSILSTDELKLARWTPVCLGLDVMKLRTVSSRRNSMFWRSHFMWGLCFWSLCKFRTLVFQ